MRVVSPLSKPLVGAGVAPLMFRCAIVVGLVFLLRMSKSESAPLMPVRTEQRGGGAAVQEAEQEHQLVEAAAPAAAAVPGTVRTSWARTRSLTRSGNVPNGGKLAFL